MKLSQKQIDQLLSLIDANIDGFIARHISPSYLSKEQKRRLKKFGIKTEGRMTVDIAFKLGMLSDMLGRKSRNMTFAEMVKQLKAKNYLPLSYVEQRALDRIRYNSYNEIKGLGNKWKQDMSRIIIEGDKKLAQKRRDQIRDVAEEAIQNRKGFRWMASEMRDRTMDRTRDWDRVADYIMHDAHDHGRAYDLMRRYGEGAKAYKHVFDQACKHCVRLYLTDGAHSKPKVFTIKELLANGTNIGRKVANWKPVIGATHPWCRCELENVPKGSVWSDEEQRFLLVATDEERELMSKIKFSITED